MKLPSPSLLQSLSRLFFWGLEGTALKPSQKSFLKKYPPAGIILFKKNLESYTQIRRLNESIQKTQKSPIWIGVDEEGGRVSRLPPPFVKYPPAAFWGWLYEKDPSLVRRMGRLLGGELLSLGFNLDFAPVLDVHSNPANPIIGDRAFSTDPHQAADVALAFLDGMRRSGIVACGKHFPGHGDTKTDSHLTLPRVTKSQSSLEKIELSPFQQAIRVGIPMLMTAHVVYTAWDKKHPATHSSVILEDILRKKLGFRGVIISDDLKMKAVSNRHSLVESSLRSLEAGVDILLICEDPLSSLDSGVEVIAHVAREIQSSSFLQKRLKESLRRVEVLRKKLSNEKKR